MAKKIREASNLGALGVPDKLVGKIAQSYKLKHDEEFHTLKTKGEMKANLKNGKLIIGISPEGKIASLGKEGGWGAGKSVKITVDGDQEWANTITDALNLVPGRGWKWFASESSSAGESRPDKWQQKFRKKQGEASDTMIQFGRLLDRVYKDKISSDAKEYAQDVRAYAMEVLDKDASNELDPEHRDQDRSYRDLRDVQKSFKLLHMIANSKDPFLQIAKQAHTGHFGVHRISQYLENKIKRYDGYGSNEETVAIFLRNEPLAAQKIVKYFSNELKKLRDSAIGAKGDAKMASKMSLPKVKKAWESYKHTGNTGALAEAFDDEEDSVLRNLGQDIKRKVTGKVTDKYHILSQVDRHVERAIKTAEWAMKDDWDDKDDALNLIRNELIELKKWIRNRNK